MNKPLLVGVTVVVFVAGALVMLAGSSTGVGNFIGFMGDLKPRVMTLILLPFAVVAVLGFIYLRKKNEERRWKEAIKRTRANQQKQSAGK